MGSAEIALGGLLSHAGQGGHCCCCCCVNDAGASVAWSDRRNVVVGPVCLPAAVTGDHERDRIRRRVAQIRAAGARNEEEGEETPGANFIGGV